MLSKCISAFINVSDVVQTVTSVSLLRKDSAKEEAAFTAGCYHDVG